VERRNSPLPDLVPKSRRNSPAKGKFSSGQFGILLTTLFSTPYTYSLRG
jgi:hypothetical protein